MASAAVLSKYQVFVDIFDVDFRILGLFAAPCVWTLYLCLGSDPKEIVSCNLFGLRLLGRASANFALTSIDSMFLVVCVWLAFR
jgi:hypothetical protein